MVRKAVREYGAARMDIKIYKRLKLYCAKSDRTVIDVLTEIVADFLSSKNRRKG